MNRSLLLKNVLVKDLKTLLRDRQQLFALIIGFASAVLTVGSIEFSIAIEKSEKEKAAKAALERAEKEGAAAPGSEGGEAGPAGAPGTAQAADGKAAGQAGGQKPDPFRNAPPAALRWLVIACGVGVGWYASLFVLPLGFATFAGERERGTLEVLLAAPVPDGTLYAFKSLGVTAPGVGYGIVLLALSLAYALLFHPGLLDAVPLVEVILGTLLSLPLIVALCGIHVALGACCSVRAKTTQAAGMLLGGILTALIFLISGAGALLFFTPASEPTMKALLWVSQRHFALQYLLVSAIFAAAWALLYFFGRALFVREKMLLV